jgi:hypothetical protein
VKTPTDDRITDHEFVPRAQWWGLCDCGLAESAHVRTSQPPGGWPPDYDARTARGDGDYGDGPQPELPPASTHDANLLDIELLNTVPKKED